MLKPGRTRIARLSGAGQAMPCSPPTGRGSQRLPKPDSALLPMPAYTYYLGKSWQTAFHRVALATAFRWRKCPVHAGF